MYKYFELDEFTCSETGDNFIKHDFVATLDKMRERCGFPFVINSGYRSPMHTKEVCKPTPGQHCAGQCADIAVKNSHQRYMIITEAIKSGFTGLGIAANYVHIDRRKTPAAWVYKK